MLVSFEKQKMFKSYGAVYFKQHTVTNSVAFLTWKTGNRDQWRLCMQEWVHPRSSRLRKRQTDVRKQHLNRRLLHFFLKRQSNCQ